VTAESEAPDDGSYIRGGGGVAVDAHRVIRVVVVFTLLALLAIAVLLAVAALRSNSRADRLKAHGVAVDVTVTSCLGEASGTGITVTGFKCDGMFTLGGRSYTEVIIGNSANHQAGDIVKAVTDPSDPADLSTADSVAAAHGSSADFALAVIPAALFVVLLVFARRSTLRRRSD
jgi:hypothetical protein